MSVLYRFYEMGLYESCIDFRRYSCVNVVEIFRWACPVSEQMEG